MRALRIMCSLLMERSQRFTAMLHTSLQWNLPILLSIILMDGPHTLRISVKSTVTILIVLTLPDTLLLRGPLSLTLSMPLSTFSYSITIFKSSTLTTPAELFSGLRVQPPHNLTTFKNTLIITNSTMMFINKEGRSCTQQAGFASLSLRRIGSTGRVTPLLPNRNLPELPGPSLHNSTNWPL